MHKDQHISQLPSATFSPDITYQQSTQQHPLNALRLAYLHRNKIMIAIIIFLAIVFIFFQVRNLWWEYKLSNDQHRHDDRTFSYPTVGIPVPGMTYNNTKVADQHLAQFDRQFLEAYQPYNVPLLLPQDTDCQFSRYGDMDPQFGGQGGYLVCENYIKQSKGMINIGINGFDAFGCSISKIGNFINEQYDCINPTETPCSQNANPNHMHELCLGTDTEQHYGRKFSTYQDILEQAHLQNKNIFLKIDCQGCQYPGLKYLPVELLDKVDQIVGEWHFRPIYYEEWGMIDIMKTLAQKFVVVNLHMTNFACANSQLREVKALAVQYTMVNKRLINKNSQSRSFALHELNKPADYNRVDCQMIE